MTANMPKPRIPAALKRLGVTNIKRTTGSVFNLGYELVGEDTNAEGNGRAICSAAARKWPEATISWPGTQSHAITLDFTAHWNGEPLPPAAKGRAEDNEPKPEREATALEVEADKHLGDAETALRKAKKALESAGHTNSVERVRAIRKRIMALDPINEGDAPAA